MCGVCGFVGFQRPGLIEEMTKRLIHRGPDEVGYYASPSASLGCRRLSVIDLSGGQQPVFNEDRSVALVQNGEIYNYKEVREELTTRGHRFVSQGDTEVLVHAYEEYGDEFCRVLNGDFAIALWDMKKKSLLLARDRMGVHPLYYVVAGDRLIFASEMKSLLAWDGWPRRLDPSAIDAFLALRYVPHGKTFFSEVRKLPPASYLTFKNGVRRLGRYWEVPPVPDGGRGAFSAPARAEELGALLRDSVRLRMRSDVPVGAYLSAGVDSALLVSLMRPLTNHPPRTFTVGFGLPGDEIDGARALATRFDTDHEEVLLGARDFELLPKILWHLDEPIGDAIVLPTFRLAQAAARRVKVVLSGEGADELWGGYVHHQAIARTDFLAKGPRWMRRALAWGLARAPLAALDRVFPYPARLGRRGRAAFARFLSVVGETDLSKEYLALASVNSETERSQMYAPGFVSALAPAVREGDFPDVGSRLRRVMEFDIHHWLPDYTLLKQDKLGFANSLEIRVPHLDHRIVEFAARVPDNNKIRGGTTKRLLRQAAAGSLPVATAAARKRAFYLPTEKVFGPAYDRCVRDVLLSARCLERGVFSPPFLRKGLNTVRSTELLENKQIFTWLMLELWFRTFVDGGGEAPAAL